MRFGKKKGKREPSAEEKLKKLCPNVKKEDLLTVFEFDLDRDIPGKRREGLVFADKEYLTVFVDGNEESKLSLDGIARFNVEPGVGTVFVSYIDANGCEKLLCLSDMKYAGQIQSSIKLLNRLKERGAEYFEKIKNARQDRRGFSDKTEGKGRRSDRVKTLARLWSMIRPYKWFVGLSMFLFAVVSGLNLIIPEINKILTDDYIISKTSETANASKYVMIVLLMLLSQVVLRVIGVLRSHALIHASNGMMVDLRDMLFEKIQRLSIEKISKRTAGELMHRASHDITRIQHFLVHSFPALVEQILLFVAIGIVFIVNDLGLLLLLILLPVPLVMFGFRFFWKKVRRLFRRCWQAGSTSNSVLHDIFSGIRVVKSFGMEHKETKRYEDAAAKERDLQIKADTLMAVVMPFMQFFMCKTTSCNHLNSIFMTIQLSPNKYFSKIFVW